MGSPISRGVTSTGTLEALPSTAAWHLSEHIYPLFHDGGMAYIDARGSGEWLAADRACGSTILHACHLLGRSGLDWQELEEEPPLNVVRLKEVASEGIISPGPGSDEYSLPLVRRVDNPALYAGNVLQSRPREKFFFSPYEISVARDALHRAVRIVRLPLSNMVGALTAARLNAPTPATTTQALRIANAVRQTSLEYCDLGRMACLELAAATLLAGSTEGLQISMQLGVAVDPYTPHAWPIAQNVAIQTAYDEPIENRYYPLMTI
jgi:hypothetical protein